MLIEKAADIVASKFGFNVANIGKAGRNIDKSRVKCMLVNSLIAFDYLPFDIKRFYPFYKDTMLTYYKNLHNTMMRFDRMYRDVYDEVILEFREYDNLKKGE